MPIRLIREENYHLSEQETAENPVLTLNFDGLLCTTVRNRYKKLCKEDPLTPEAERYATATLIAIQNSPSEFKTNAVVEATIEQLHSICDDMTAAVKSNSCIVNGALVSQTVSGFYNDVQEELKKFLNSANAAIEVFTAALVAEKIMAVMRSIRFFGVAILAKTPQTILLALVIAIVTALLELLTRLIASAITAGLTAEAIAQEISATPEFAQAVKDTSCALIDEQSRIHRNNFVAAPTKPCSSFWDDVVITGLEESLAALEEEGTHCPIAQHQIEILRQEYDSNCTDEDEGSASAAEYNCDNFRLAAQWEVEDFEDGFDTCEQSRTNLENLRSALVNFETDSGKECTDAHSLLGQLEFMINADCPAT